MEATTDQIATIAALNDIARRTMGVTCRTVITQGIAALDENTQSDILKMIEGFEDFTPDNDQHGEHDAGFLYRDVIDQRSEERRGGKGWVSTCNLRGSTI